jgi:hypothetical protein
VPPVLTVVVPRHCCSLSLPPVPLPHPSCTLFLPREQLLMAAVQGVVVWPLSVPPHEQLLTAVVLGARRCQWY